jgi:hypothetical protein
MEKIKIIVDAIWSILGAIDYMIDVYTKLEPVVTRILAGFF